MSPAGQRVAASLKIRLGFTKQKATFRGLCDVQELVSKDFVSFSETLSMHFFFIFYLYLWSISKCWCPLRILSAILGPIMVWISRPIVLQDDFLPRTLL